MLDNLSLDQLRAFAAAVDEGSFSAAGRKMNRVQSAISELVAKLEANVGVLLFDRGRRPPTLTKGGAALLTETRSILAGVDVLRARAKGMSSGIEPELSVVIDVMFPIGTITEAAKAFRRAFPGTPLRIDVEVLGGAYHPILDGRACLGIVRPLPTMPAGLTTEWLLGIAVVLVAAQNHPLSLQTSMISKADLARHVQLVLTDPSTMSEARDFNIPSPFTWRLADLFAKRAFLLEGLGWGVMPRHAVEGDIAEGRLTVLSVEDIPARGWVKPMVAAYLTAEPPGPAGQWFIKRLKNSRPRAPGAYSDQGHTRPPELAAA